MILPLMGLLFGVFATGLLSAVVLSLVRPWRRSLPLVVVPILGATGSLLLCWGLAVGL